MRSFFWFLVLVNLGYFGWRQFGADLVTESSAPQNSPAAASLTRLSELPEPPELRTAAIAVPQAQEPPVSPSGAVIVETVAKTEQEARVQVQPLETARVCAVVAGFTASEAALTLVQTLQSVQLTAFTVSGDEQAVPIWWVYLPKFASEAAARRTLTELHQKGIDSYYLNSGELAGGISLGVFTRREGALRTQEDLAKRGYKASIQASSRQASRYRVVVEGRPETLLATPVMQDFLEKNPSLDVSDFVCEGVAEPKQFP